MSLALFDLTGKRALVTGSSQGIGLALAGAGVWALVGQSLAQSVVALVLRRYANFSTFVCKQVHRPLLGESIGHCFCTKARIRIRFILEIIEASRSTIFC